MFYCFFLLFVSSKNYNITEPSFYQVLIHKKDKIVIDSRNKTSFFHFQNSYIFHKLELNVKTQNEHEYKKKIKENERLSIINSIIEVTFSGDAPAYFSLWIIDNNICNTSNNVNIPNPRESNIVIKGSTFKGPICWFIEYPKESVINFDIDKTDNENTSIFIYYNTSSFEEITNSFQKKEIKSKIFLLSIKELKSQETNITFHISSKSKTCDWDNSEDFFNKCNEYGNCLKPSLDETYVFSNYNTSKDIWLGLCFPSISLFLFIIYLLFKPAKDN